MNEDHVIECFKDTLETSDGHILREDGEYAGALQHGDVIILDYNRYQKLQDERKHLYHETKYIPQRLRKILNKIGRIFNWNRNWGEIDHFYCSPKRCWCQS